MPHLRSKNVRYHFTAQNNQGQVIANLHTDILVGIDASAQHHKNQVQVDALLDASAQAIGIMNREYPDQAWFNAGNELQYRVQYQAGLFMLFRWNNGPYLFHIDVPREQYKQERNAAFRKRGDDAFKDNKFYQRMFGSH